MKHSLIWYLSFFLSGSWLLFCSSCGFSAGSPYPKHDGPSKIITSGKDPKPLRILRKQSPELVNYEELKSLSLDPKAVSPSLQSKVNKLFHTAFVENTSKKAPSVPHSDELGSFLRVTSWNTEQSRHLKTVLRDLSNKTPSSENHNTLALEQLKLIKDSDIFILQEMDIGHPRSAYLHTPQAMAKALGMNYAYGVQYLEVDPVYLNISDAHLKNKDAQPSPSIVKPADRHKYRGLFGNAVLSRYPIKKAEIIPLKGVNYDWYAEEAQSYDLLETTRRSASNLFFHQRPRRELKLGSRAFLRVDLHIPELPLQTLTIINIHLEIKLPVAQRRAQLEEILKQIKTIPNPVVLAGDFNSSTFNIGPTSLVKEAVKNVTTPKGIGDIALSFSQFMQVSRVKDIINFFKNNKNPLAGHVPVLFENSQHKTFKTLRDFRFEDGGAFDFRGDKAYSIGRSGILSNSNQRGSRGFVPTFTVKRPLGPIGREKLDWIFVKSFLRAPNDARGSRRLSPQFGQTLRAFNHLNTDRYSDHDPITVVLPLDELSDTDHSLQYAKK